jgi:hypothetical protein
MSTPVRSGYYGDGDTDGDGDGVADVHAVSDSTSFPGRFVDAAVSVQGLGVVIKKCWVPLLIWVAITGPIVPTQENVAVSIPGVVVPLWLLTKCQVTKPVPHGDTAGTLPGFMGTARAGVTS